MESRKIKFEITKLEKVHDKHRTSVASSTATCPCSAATCAAESPSTWSVVGFSGTSRLWRNQPLPLKLDTHEVEPGAINQGCNKSRLARPNHANTLGLQLGLVWVAMSVSRHCGMRLGLPSMSALQGSRQPTQHQVEPVGGRKQLSGLKTGLDLVSLVTLLRRAFAKLSRACFPLGGAGFALTLLRRPLEMSRAAFRYKSGTPSVLWYLQTKEEQRSQRTQVLGCHTEL